MNPKKRAALALLLGWSLFALAAAVPTLMTRLGMGAVLEAHAWLPHFLVKTVLAALSLLAIALGGQSLSAAGFRRSPHWRWVPAILPGLVLGMIATILIFVTPARGMGAVLERMGFFAMVLSVWIYSSVTEEIFARGWFQSFLLPAFTGPTSLPPVVGSVPGALSALLFSTIHLSLLLRGVDLWTVGIVMGSTFLLGVVAAKLRESSGSLAPAVVAHVAFNVGGMLGGVVATVVRKLLFGTVPTM